MFAKPDAPDRAPQTLRPAHRGDLTVLSALFATARLQLAEQGSDQWQDGYPTLEQLRADIDARQAWVIDVEGQVLAYAAIAPGPDPDYAEIEGAWRTDAQAPYMTVHRVVVAAAAQGLGLCSRLLEHAIALAREAGHASVRGDTHELNAAMQACLEGRGFVVCGRIYLRGGQPRRAYERLIGDAVDDV